MVILVASAPGTVRATTTKEKLDKAKEAGADLVFMPIYYQEASVILKQASDKEFAPVFFGVDGMDGILSVENFDTSLAEGVMLLTPFSATEESSKAFTDAYVAAYGIEPNQFAADAYDAVYAVKAAAEKAGITPDMDASSICDAMKTLREASRTGFQRRFEQAVTAGDLPPDADVAALAAVFTAVLQGMSVQARDGAPREELERIARTSLAMLPAPGLSPNPSLRTQ